jgi:hypothetical protein
LINPCANSSAIQVASRLSVFVPGRCRTSWLWAAHTTDLNVFTPAESLALMACSYQMASKAFTGL